VRVLPGGGKCLRLQRPFPIKSAVTDGEQRTKTSLRPRSSRSSWILGPQLE
jgi:hypothetical protein